MVGDVEDGMWRRKEGKRFEGKGRRSIQQGVAGYCAGV